MKYIYPLLSDRDLNIVRIGGAGLGNILFTYARAVVYASRDKDIKLIWPTWPSFRVRLYLNREKDKRSYVDLFRNNSGYISGLKKIYLRMFKSKITEEEYIQGKDATNKIIELRGFAGCFDSIMNDSHIVKADIIKNLAKKNYKATTFDASDAICMHVRLGDFTRTTMDQVLSGRHNSTLPINWYVVMAKELRRITGRCTKIYIFSDGTDEELKPLLSLDNVERKTFGTAIADILALSKAGVFVASGSSFSMWARYLGRMTTIMFPNQVKQTILQEDEENKEIVAFDCIPAEYDEIIRKSLHVK